MGGLSVIDDVCSGSGLAIKKLEQALAKESDLKKIRNWERQFSSAESSLKKCRDGEVITLQTQNVAAKARALCSWTGGQLIKGMEKRAGAKGKGKKVEGHDDPPLLKDALGTETASQARNISKRWQAIAEIPRNELEQMTDVDAVSDTGKEITQSSLIKRGKEIRKQAAKKNSDAASGVVSDDKIVCNTLTELIATDQTFRCIYADPPWAYDNSATRSNVKSEYKSTMSVDEIAAEPIKSLAEDNAILFLWTTCSFLPDSFRVMKEWGFTYKTNLVWTKPQLGIGNYVRVSHEHLLLGIRGKVQIAPENRICSWMSADRTKHSRKPLAFRLVIEQMTEGPYLEMYGRERVPGWTVYGNEIEDGLF